MTRLVLISDTHCQLEKLQVPDGDILVHAGDLTYRGDIQTIAIELAKMKKLPHPTKLLICGNHDWLGEHNPSLMREMCTDAGVTYLDHEAITMASINFFGSAYTPEFYNWSFNVPRDELKPYWDAIPDNTHILVTHGPPRGILDKCPDGFLAGCDHLLKRTQELPNLTHHIYGHIHEGYGIKKVGNVTYINASGCTGNYKPTNPAVVLDI